MSCASLEHVQAEISTTAVLHQLAAEIDQVAADCRTLEALIGAIFSNVPRDVPLQGLQALDLIIQRIDGTKVVLKALADHAPDSSLPRDRVLGGVSLADLADRLEGVEARSANAPAGDVEFW